MFDRLMNRHPIRFMLENCPGDFIDQTGIEEFQPDPLGGPSNHGEMHAHVG
jgi:hypothetical protein